MQKPIDFESLLRNINRALDNKVQQRKLELLSSTDPTTKLLNKHVIHDLFKEWKIYKSRFLVIVIDLDDFKSINDTFGHAMGDRVLQAFGNKLRSTFRSSDVICRFGGDEFLLFVEANDPEEIECKLHGIEKQVIENIEVRASYGIAIYPDEQENFDRLFKRADRRMYERKKKKKP